MSFINIWMQHGKRGAIHEPLLLIAGSHKILKIVFFLRISWRPGFWYGSKKRRQKIGYKIEFLEREGLKNGKQQKIWIMHTLQRPTWLIRIWTKTSVKYAQPHWPRTSNQYPPPSWPNIILKYSAQSRTKTSLSFSTWSWTKSSLYSTQRCKWPKVSLNNN